MKKLLVALSFMAVLVFMGTPSMALVGTPDAVPGTHVLQPFFLVSFDGDLDTLTSLIEVKGYASAVHWTIYDKMSIHRANGDIPYTPFDVISISWRNVLETAVSIAGLAALEVDLDEDGTNDHWMGYVEFINARAWRPGIDNEIPHVNLVPEYDNLIGKMYLVELANGLASGANIPSREVAYRNRNPHGGPGWWLEQYTYLSLPYQGIPWPIFTDYEVWNAFAYATSKARENGYNPHLSLPDQPGDPVFPCPAYLRLLPRYFLLNDTANTWIFVWSSANMGSLNVLADPDHWIVPVNIWDEDEHAFSTQVDLPWELNFINIRNILPGAWAPPIGGWVDINFDIDPLNLPIVLPDPGDDWIDVYPDIIDIVPLAAEWLCYSYQVASSPNASLNWGALFDSHRDIGTFINLLDL